MNGAERARGAKLSPRLGLALALACWILPATAGAAEPPGDRNCWDCHDGASFTRELLPQGGADSLRLTESLFRASVHSQAGLSCVDCHVEIKAIPHPDSMGAVRCDGCHAAEAAEYAGSIHGAAREGGNRDAPGCADCHGTHGILSSSDRGSPSHKLNAAMACARCHADPDVVARNHIPAQDPLAAYRGSVHGRALLVDGNVKAPGCADCHGAHDVRPAADPASRVSKMHVPSTCGRCHGEIAAVFQASVHGQSVARGNPDAPACNDCHGEHRIESPGNPTSLVYPENLVRTTCVRCHESLILGERYGFPSDRGATFLETYHGLAGRLGGLRVANCASCHGIHDIFPSSDPRSTISPGRLQETCGKCHPSAGASFVQISVHAPATVAPLHAAARGARLVYIVLVTTVIGGMCLHNLIVWRSYVVRKYKAQAAQPMVERFRRFEVLEHAVLTVAFFGLVVTGFALKYSDAAWVRGLSDLGFHEASRRVLHRIFGVILIVVSLGHGVLLVATRRGRSDLRALRPSRRDFSEFLGSLRFYLGKTPTKPRAAKFDYAEKAEYLALIWGVIAMAATGLVLWYPANVTRWAPGWVVEVSEVVHFYEAWLAFLAIMVWHFFFVVFHPEEFPLNTTVSSGKVPREKAEERDWDHEPE